MRFSARAVKTLPRTWFMSVTVLSLPDREANSAARLSDSRSCCSSRAWKTQRVGWSFLRSMRQERPSVNWRRHLLSFESKESDFIGNLRREGFGCLRQPGPRKAGRRTETRRAQRQLTTELCYWNAAEGCSSDWAWNLTGRILPQSVELCQDNFV